MYRIGQWMTVLLLQVEYFHIVHTSHLKAASQISVLQCHREQVKSGEEKDGGRNQTFIDDSLY